MAGTKARRARKGGGMTFNGTTVLVCGGAGFIGSNFIHYILGAYKTVRIVNLDKLTYSGNLDNLRDIARDPRYTFVRGDIADARKVKSVFGKYKPDYVINFAAETHVDRRIRKFVQVSTDEVYGSLSLGSKKKFLETTAFAPNVPYAATKAGGDMLCRSYHNTWKAPVVVTHCSNNYGPRQYPEKLIPFFVLRMLEGQKLPLYGDGRR